MDSHLFLSAMLPTAGTYCVATIVPQPGGKSIVGHHFCKTLEEVASLVELLDYRGDPTYFALASFDDAGKRRAENALFMRCLFIDIDCGEGKAYPAKREAMAALVKFCEDTRLDRLGSPWVVDSGGGLHVYWPLLADATIAEWLPVAESLKYNARVYGFNIDITVTADAARVLRVPGSHNSKYNPPRQVRLKFAAKYFSLADIAAALSVHENPTVMHSVPSGFLAIPGQAPSRGPMSAVATALMANSATYFRNIMKRTVEGSGCAQITDYTNKAANDGMEPVWRAMLSLSKHCVDGDKASKWLSDRHPYPHDRMMVKLAAIKGPYSCAKLDTTNPGICGHCPHWGKITNPLALGREMITVTEPTDIDMPEEENEPAMVVHRPAPPNGYFFGPNGGVFIRKVEIDPAGRTFTNDVMLVPYDLFMIDMLLEDGVYTSRFMALKGGKKIILAIPNKLITSKDNTMAALASQNIVAAFGAGNDKSLYDYVRACVGEASAQENALIVPPNYGWQPDDSFALGDAVYRSDGTNYTFVSNRLANLIDVTKTKGDLQSWASVMEMLMQKELWGQMVTMAMGFGSALMHFAPAGARAASFHIASSTSGIGKTLALAVSNSVWGHPTNYSVKPATSERTMLQRAGMLGSLPLSMDEVTNKVRGGDKEWMPNHIFDFSQGGHKLKGMGAANAEMRDDLRWEAICIMTSNAPMMEVMMGARDTTSHGEVKRMLEWNGGSTALTWTASEREVLRLLNHNYGVAGRVFIEWCVKHQEIVQAVMAEALTQWREYMFAPDDERFWTSMCAANLAALTLLGPKYANIITVPLRPCMEFLRKRVLEARRIINTNRTFAMDILDTYVKENNGFFVKLAAPDQAVAVFADGRDVRPDSTRSQIRGRVEHNTTPGWTDLYIDIRSLKSFCAQRNKSYLEFVRELQLGATVEEVRKDLTAKTKGPTLRVVALKISRPNTDA